MTRPPGSPVPPAATPPAERELVARAHVAAPPERVWAVLSDLTRMPGWSPELVRMVPLKRGGLRVGQWYLGVNRRGAVVWPTRSVVTRLEPGRALAWDTVSSGARWVWELEPVDGGTEVVHRRPVPAGVSPVSKVFAPLFLGGSEGHADELEAGMARTVERLAAAVAG
jgi:uncharacterized protein YndB with AHSA1/START domain